MDVVGFHLKTFWLLWDPSFLKSVQSAKMHDEMIMMNPFGLGLDTKLRRTITTGNREKVKSPKGSRKKEENEESTKVMRTKTPILSSRDKRRNSPPLKQSVVNHYTNVRDFMSNCAWFYKPFKGTQRKRHTRVNRRGLFTVFSSKAVPWFNELSTLYKLIVSVTSLREGLLSFKNKPSLKVQKIFLVEGLRNLWNQSSLHVPLTQYCP